MFVEKSEASKSSIPWLERFARLHPRGFDVLIIGLGFAVTVLQLYKTSSAVVLYQGF